MIGTLLKLRLRSMLFGLTSQANSKRTSRKGMTILFGILFVYLGVAAFAMMWLVFDSLAAPYHLLNLDWLYFSMAGVMATGFSLLGSVFTTQSQLYDAKDNALLLSMPIRPGQILLSRMLALLGVNLLFCSVIMIPAFVVYLVQIQFSWGVLLCLVPALLGATFLAQSLACLLGWILHLLLRRCNKSIASLLFMMAFLGVYFWVYSQASTILNTMATGAGSIADALESWVWPLYAMGMGCSGSYLYLLAYLGICAAIFYIVYWVLSRTFLATATASQASKKRRKLDLKQTKHHAPTAALTVKELRKFIGTPIFLTNMGLGLIMILAVAVLGVIFREKLLSYLAMLEAVLGDLSQMIPLLICAILIFLNSTCCLSTPTVSLEGKNIWILKSAPVSSKSILQAKLRFHLVLTVPMNLAAAVVLGFAYGCTVIEVVLVALIAGLAATLTGTLGMCAGLKWAKLDYISEVHPCKQSIAVLVSIFGIMTLPLILGLGYWALFDLVSPTLFMACTVVLLVGLCYVFYRTLLTWGVRKWDSL